MVGYEHSLPERLTNSDFISFSIRACCFTFGVYYFGFAYWVRVQIRKRIEETIHAWENKFWIINMSIGRERMMNFLCF